ncbi:MAG: SMP-30/gluconolactonase/LRE family protein, partial [Planctomycetota bacterium]|nr:SMP-30/gluconolactonase/LRE family protein [Planctomycetota bacterium]
MIKRKTQTDQNSQSDSGLARRDFLTAAAAIAVGAHAAIAQDKAASPKGRTRYGKNADPVRYPDPDIVVLDDRFKKYKIGNSAIRRVYHSKDMAWAEGPAWNGVGRYLLWSDIPNNVQLRYLEEDGHVSTFRHPSGNSNGNTFDFAGRQISCEHGNRRVVRYEYDGTITVLAHKVNGKELNAPNDAIVHPDDGAIWFTDPGYGSLMNYEGHKANTGSVQPLQKEAVYRI